MLAHLFVLVIVPLARRLSAVLTYLLVAALGLTLPARVWVLYIDPSVEGTGIVLLHGLGLVIVAGMSFCWFRSRRHHG